MVQEKQIRLKDGREITEVTLTNKKGMGVTFLSLGGIIRKINVPDRNGNVENILLDYEDINDYIENPGYLNALVGRVGGRIHKAEFTLGGKQYPLAKNDGENTLHGGTVGFDKKIWQIQTFAGQDSCGARLLYTSLDGEEGYPGQLKVEVTYFLDEENRFTITYKAATTQDTLVNLTHHAYFNLSGEGKRSIEDQMLQIGANQFCELDESSIPTGKLLSVEENGAFDFTKEKAIGQDIVQDHPQLKYTKGYDHPWVLIGTNPAVALRDPISGRKMEVLTNQKAVVVYAMNYENPCLFTNGKKNVTREGICFETQGLPIGHGECFKEENILKSGDQYFHQTSFCFSLE